MAAEGAERTTHYKRSGASYPQINPIYKLSTIPERSLCFIDNNGYKRLDWRPFRRGQQATTRRYEANIPAKRTETQANTRV